MRKMMKKHKLFTVAAIFVFFAVLLWILPIDAVNVSLRLKNQDTFANGEQLKIYFDAGEGFQEKDCVTGSFLDGDFVIKLNPVYNRASAIRIDIEGASGKRVLSDIEIHSGSFEENDYKTGVIAANNLADSTEIHDIGNISMTDTGIEFEITGEDPYFVLGKDGVQAFRRGIRNFWYFKLGITVVFAAVILLVFIIFTGDREDFKVRKRKCIAGFTICSVVFQIFFAWYVIRNVPDIHLTDTQKFIDYQKGDNGCFRIKKLKNGLQRVYIKVNGVDQDNPLATRTNQIRIQVLSEDAGKVLGEKHVFKGKLLAEDSYEMTLSGWYDVAGCMIKLSNADGEDIGITGISVKTSGKTLNRGFWLILFSLICNFSLMIVVLYEDVFKKKRAALGALYLLFFIMNCFKMWCYRMYVKGFPDEDYHISYVAYLSKTGKIIPRFSDMRAIAINGMNARFRDIPWYNYLGHPPLYYHILRMAHAVRFSGEQMTVDVERMRIFSNCLALLGIIVIMYIGFTRIRKDRPYWHMLYLTGIFCIPMMTYAVAGVNNDVLPMIGCAVFFLGGLRFTEGKRTYTTFILLATGISLTLLGKLTAGCVLCFTTLLFAIWYCIKEKKLSSVFCRQFFVTIPIYLTALFYFIAVYLQTGRIQPRIKDMAGGSDYRPRFFVEFENRASIGIWKYIGRFISKFTGQWTGIASHISLKHMGANDSIGFLLRVSVWILPLLLCITYIEKKGKKQPAVGFGTPKEAFLGCTYIAVILTIIVQMIRAAGNFYYKTGYLGSIQSRYYLCIAPLLVYCEIVLLEKHDEKIGRRMNLLLLLCFIYFMFSDFIFFLINYDGFRI